MQHRRKKAVDAAAAHFGAIDALINIAGFTFETIADGDPKAWQRMYALNVETALNASRAAIPYLLGGRTASSISVRWALCRPAPAWVLWGVEGGRAQADGDARCRTERRDHRKRGAAFDHRYRGKPRQHAKSRSD
jgi:NAD(P)-dependent dehydrogenase (short-subunit alcohol dehydrogenase family)